MEDTVQGKIRKRLMTTVQMQKWKLKKSKERYISLIFFQQSGKKHNKLKVDLKNTSL